jgi:hypothetical protein
MTEGRTINTGGGDYREINVSNGGQYAEGNIINHLSGEQQQTLAEAAAEIKELREQLGTTKTLIQRRESRRRLRRRCRKSRVIAI